MLSLSLHTTTIMMLASKTNLHGDILQHTEASFTWCIYKVRKGQLVPYVPILKSVQPMKTTVYVHNQPTHLLADFLASKREGQIQSAKSLTGYHIWVSEAKLCLWAHLVARTLHMHVAALHMYLQLWCQPSVPLWSVKAAVWMWHWQPHGCYWQWTVLLRHL